MDSEHSEPVADDNNEMTLHIDTIINETQVETEAKSCNDSNNSNGRFLLEMASQPPTIHGNICISARVCLCTYIHSHKHTYIYIISTA